MYHAPGYQQWQKYRADLVGSDIGQRATKVASWNSTHSGLANLVRCVNVLRSLRGSWSSHPELKKLHDRLSPQMDKAWKGESAGGGGK